MSLRNKKLTHDHVPDILNYQYISQFFCVLPVPCTLPVPEDAESYDNTSSPYTHTSTTTVLA